MYGKTCHGEERKHGAWRKSELFPVSDGFRLKTWSFSSDLSDTVNSIHVLFSPLNSSHRQQPGGEISSYADGPISSCFALTTDAYRSCGVTCLCNLLHGKPKPDCSPDAIISPAAAMRNNLFLRFTFSTKNLLFYAFCTNPTHLHFICTRIPYSACTFVLTSTYSPCSGASVAAARRRWTNRGNTCMLVFEDSRVREAGNPWLISSRSSRRLFKESYSWGVRCVQKYNVGRRPGCNPAAFLRL